MNKQEALSILNCTQYSDNTELETEFNLKVFELKQKFLMVIPPLKIMQSLIKRLERLQKVNQVLNLVSESKNRTEINIEFNNTSLVEFLKTYHQYLSQLKLNISNNIHPQTIIRQIHQLIDLQTQLFLKLSGYGNFKPNTSELEDVKLSETINTFELEQEILFLSIPDSKLSEYISQKKDTYFYKCILMAKKQIEYNGLRRKI